MGHPPDCPNRRPATTCRCSLDRAIRTIERRYDRTDVDVLHLLDAGVTLDQFEAHIQPHVNAAIRRNHNPTSVSS